MAKIQTDRLAWSRRAAAITVNRSTVSSSPRAVGVTPALVRMLAAASGPAAQPARAERSILRRWANAASTTANTSADDTAPGPVWAGGSRRVKATKPDSTLGTGQNTFAGTLSACRDEAYQASLTLGMP